MYPTSTIWLNFLLIRKRIAMKRPDQVKRGELYFRRIEPGSGINNPGSVIECSLGEFGDPESEFIFKIHEAYIPDVIAGLTALIKIKK